MDYDVIIIGSGPAGCSAAHFLADSGLKIAMIERLDRDGFVKYHKICGGGVGEKAFADLPLKDDEIRNRIEGIGLSFPDGKHISIRSKGYIIDRPKFLDRIRKECMDKGIRIMKDSVIDVFEKDGEYTVTGVSGLWHSCKYIIGADGVYSVVRRSLFNSSPKECIPVTEYIVREDPPGDLEFTVGPKYRGGYGWRFPCGGNLCTSAVNHREEMECISKGSRFIPTGGVGDIVKGNAMLIGDSAAMANPISYGGLRTAILSGRMAAKAVIDGNPEELAKWWKGEKYSDPRFMELHRYISELTEEDYNKLSAPLRYKNFWLDGFIACLTHPKNGWIYFGCLFAFRHGW